MIGSLIGTAAVEVLVEKAIDAAYSRACEGVKPQSAFEIGQSATEIPQDVFEMRQGAFEMLQDASQMQQSAFEIEQSIFEMPSSQMEIADLVPELAETNGFEMNKVYDVHEGFIDITCDLDEGLSSRQTAEGVQEIREQYPNVDNVLGDISEKLEDAHTEMDFMDQMSRIEKYKGTVFEDMAKEELKPLFESMEEKQMVVETVEGDTKPDIVLRDAKEDFVIGNTEVKQGEDLFCEVKCGKKEYIESEMAHIEKQVLGHQEGKSVVIVSSDYLEIAVDKRINFEARLEARNSSVCVVDVAADEVSSAIVDNVIKYR